MLRFSSYPESMQMSTDSSFKYPWKLVFFNSSETYLSAPRWSTSLPCLLLSQDSLTQCLLSLPWWGRHPLPPTNIRAMKTLSAVKPTCKGPLQKLPRAERSLLKWRWESSEAPRFLQRLKERAGIFRAKWTANHCTRAGPDLLLCSPISRPLHASSTPFPIAVTVQFISLPG